VLLPVISAAIVNLTSSTYPLADFHVFQKYSTTPQQNEDKSSKSPQQLQQLDDYLQCKHGQRKYTMFGQYATTKWCSILHTLYLAENYSGCSSSSRSTRKTVAAIHPGLVRTDVVRNMPWYLKLPNTVFGGVVATLQKTPDQGAWCTVHVVALAATASSSSGTDNDDDDKHRNTPINRSGSYYWVNRQSQPLVVPLDQARQQAAAVWEWAVQQVGLTATECEQLLAVATTTTTTHITESPNKKIQ
jgi:hypothetical protein